MKRVLILGSMGYIGWPLGFYLEDMGYEVCRLDSMIKNWWKEELGIEALGDASRGPPDHFLDVADKKLYELFEDFQPDAIVHLAEQPSAPLSMLSHRWSMTTMRNNILGTQTLLFAASHLASRTGKVPHIVKLGTMGEYGTPNIPIEEGWLDVHHKGHTDRMLFPKKPGSFYHASKVADSTNLEFACRAWGLRVTDLNQGVVWGMETPLASWFDPEKRTMFHYDEIFGTVINRFISQAACGFPLTIYGSGLQTRGFIHLEDSLRCIELAIDNPADEGEFRVFNQLSELLSVGQIARMVSSVADVNTAHVPNPRVEDARHLYDVAHSGLKSLGFTDPVLFTNEAIENMLDLVSGTNGIEEHRTAIGRLPMIKWSQREWQEGLSL